MFPVVTLVNGTQTVTANGANTASFSATATGVPAPTYQWQYNSGSGWLSFGAGTGTTTLSMTTNPVPVAANGWLFRLAATNSAGTGYSAAATLYVNETPTLSQLQNVTIAQGGSAAFTVTPTTTDGAVSYQWYKVGGGSPDTLLTSTGDFSISSGSTSSTLTVSPALLGDAGQYYVIVTDAVDSSNLPKTSNIASLTVTAGAWINVGSQSSARYEAMSLMLPNGTFWVAGGQNDSGLLNDDAVYTLTDATHGTWASSGSNVFVAGPHLDGTATLLPSGNVLIVGGSDGQDGKQGIEIYNSGTGTYTASNVHSIAQPTTRHVAALISNGTVLIAGGTNGWSDTYYNNAYIYDPAADTLTPVPTDSTHTLGTARAGSFAVTLSNGKVLIVGGQDVNGVDNAADLYTPNATSPSTGTFAAIAGGMTSPRLYHTATLLPNGKVLIAGGTNGSSVLNTMEIFDPAGNSGAGSFTALGTMSTTRLAHSAVLLANGKVLIFGGTNDGTTVLNSAEVIDPNYASDSGTLTIPATSMNYVRELDSATLLPNGTVLAAGGFTGSASLATAEVWGALEGYSAAPTAPNATITVTTSGGNQITVPSEADLTPTSTNTASVPLDSTASYYWKISNGSITAGQNTDQITFTSGASGSMTIPVLITDIYGFSAVGEAIPAILVPPSGLSLTPSLSSSSGSPLTSPASITLNAQYTGGTTAFISSSTGGTDIPVTSNNFTTSTLTLNQTATFTLTVLNGLGGSVTSQVTVYVTSTLPSISSQPSSVAACLNGNATFDAVSSSSSGSLTSYGWYDGATLAGAGTVSGSGPYTYQLTLSDLTAASDGNYTFHMTDGAGTTISSPATLKVGNSITQQPQSVTISPFQTATFSVAVSNVDAVSYQWHFIHSSSDTTVGTNSSIYTTPAVTSANNGDQYYVVVSDTGGCGQTALTSTSATLTVNSNYTDVPPTITVQPTGQTATVGGGATFSATAVGPGSLSYEWYRIPYGQTVGQAYAACGSGGGTGVACTLTVSGSSATNEGDKYYLKVVNGYGQTVSSSAQLAVVPGVLITSQPQTQYVGVGDTAVYSVGAMCNGCTLNYQWYVIPLGSTTASPVSGATSSALEIPDALSSQSGSVYYVVVGSSLNSQSVTSQSAGLFVGSLGAVNDECSGGGWQLNGNASTFSGTIDGSGTICGIQLVPNSYGASSSIFWPTPISTAKFSASFKVSIYANTFPADGFTMVLADPTLGASKYSTGASGGGLGADGIPGFVLGFDTYFNSGVDPCQPPYLGVGQGASNLWENPWTSTNCYLPNGSGTYYGNNGAYTNSSHNYVVTVDNGSMSVSMDGNQVFSGAVTMPPVAYLGFTGSTGGAKEQVVISNMVVTLSADTTPTLLSITVTPAAPTVTMGTTQAFTATGNYSDGTTQNLTSTVTWSDNSGGSGLWTGNVWFAPYMGVAMDTITATDAGAGVAGATVAGTTTATTALIAQAIASFNPSLTATYGQSSVTLSAVGGGSGNLVVFSIDASSTAGACSVNATSLSFTGTGTCVVDANQGGSSNYFAAPQVQKTIVVNPGAPSITVSSGTNPSTYGGSVTFTATLPANAASGGLVTFRSDSVSIGTGTVSSHIATLSISTLTAPSHAITATWVGDTNYTSAGVSNSLTQTVNRANPTVNTWPTASAITAGQTLASSTLTGGSTTPTGGSFAFTTPSTVPELGTSSQNVTYTPADTTDYNTLTNNVNVTIVASPPTPTVTVTSSATVVTAGTVDAHTTGNTASFTDGSSNAGTDTYSCSVFGGSSITAGQGTLSITFTAGASGNANPTCTITNAAGLAGTAGSTSTPINTLSSVTVIPNNMYLAEAATQQYALRGTYSDTSTANLTSLATWISGTPTVATIGSSTGLAAAQSIAGTSIITATINSTPYTTKLLVGAWTESTGAMLYNVYQALPMMELNNGSVNILWLAGGTNSVGNTYGGDSTDALPYVSTNAWTSSVSGCPGSPCITYSHLNGTATLVPSGQVIIAGGYDFLNDGAEYGIETAIEIYSPTVPAAYTVSSAVLPEATTGQVAALLTNGPNSGDVLIAGGWNDTSTFYTAASLYNPTADSLVASNAHLGTGRYGSTATTLNDGRILIVGGVDPVGSVHADTAVDIYDDLYNYGAGTNSTSNTNTVTYPSSHYTLSNGSSDIGDVFASANCGVTLVTGSACLNTARTGHTATVLPSGKVLIAGGTNASGTTALTSLEIFDPTLNSGAGGFVSLGNLQTARFNHSAVALSDGMVLIFGGTGSSGSSLNSTEVVDANWVADGWPSPSVAVANLNIPRAQAASILLPDGTSVLVTGGNIGTVSVPVDAGHDGTATTEVFFPTATVAACGSPTVSLWIYDVEVSTSSSGGEYIENPAYQIFTATLSGSETGVTWTSSGGGTNGANGCTGLSCAFEDYGSPTNLSNVTAQWGSSCSASSAWIRVMYD
jgi:hypothetical protein